MIKRNKIHSDEEHQIATYCIISTDYLQQFTSIYKPEVFQTDYAKIIAKWCIDYFSTYKEAPKEVIQDIYKVKAEEDLQESQAVLVGKFLEKLSDDFIKSGGVNNIGLLIANAEKYMHKQHLVFELKKARVYATEDNIHDAENVINNYQPLVRPISKGVNPFTDEEFVRSIFREDNPDNLFRFSGHFGRLFGWAKRKQFDAFAGPEKRGKSYWLMAILQRALLQGLNVAIFHFELSEKEFTERLLKAFTGQSMENEEIIIPVFDCVSNQFGECKKPQRTNSHTITIDHRSSIIPAFGSHNPKYQVCSYCKNKKNNSDFSHAVWWERKKKPILSAENALKKLRSINRQFIRGDRLRILSRPSDTFSTIDIANQLISWEKTEGFVPDVVLTDYADLMIPSKKMTDSRHALDNIWKGHKRLAQEFNVYVATVSQTNKLTYEKDVKKGDMAEDKRKASHTDKFLAINQNDSEKAQGIWRISSLFDRHQNNVTSRQCLVLQNLDIGNPNLDSYIPPYQKTENNEGGKKKKSK